MNLRANDFKTIVTFYDTQVVPILTGAGGEKTVLINPRQEYASINALKPQTLINGVNEDIRDSTHILQTRFRTDLSSFTTVTRECLSSDYVTTYVEQFQVNDIQVLGQENRYIICHLTLQSTNIQSPLNVGNVVTAGTVNEVTAGYGDTDEN
ncbi:hypothetical protein [Acetobacter tropicalis]|uniref:hypothetical protein n=1 Tax=Acetobacter tropicalis TaxID=104102 RepID=UPI0011D1DCF8|nr:hypothetical protein [Acetobacter tropicalis]